MSMLSTDEMLFYSRQLGIPAWGAEVQEKLKNSKVFVAGNGGLGSPVLYYLTAAGIGTLFICDCDRVDITNLNRQIIHDFGNIGELKVDSAQQSLSRLNPFISIVPINKKITARNADALVGDAHIIIDCLDNFETRHVLNRVSVRRRIPMVHAGVAEFRGQMTFLNPPETPCLACFMNMKDRKARGKIQIAGATPGVMGSLQAVEAIKYLAGFGPSLKNKLLFWDGLSMKFETITIGKNKRCPACRNYQ